MPWFKDYNRAMRISDLITKFNTNAIEFIQHDI